MTPPSQRTADREPWRVVLVTGLSGAGKSSLLHLLEDLSFETVDNPPIPFLESLVQRRERPLAIGVDVRSSGFDAGMVLAILQRLSRQPDVCADLVYVVAEETTLLTRYTETRRRHPLAGQGPVRAAITAERRLTEPLRAAADWVVDTTNLSLPDLRRQVEARYSGPAARGLSVMLISFAYPRGLPAEADLVFDARFLRNPHYEQALRERSGLDPEVGAYIAADSDYAAFLDSLDQMLSLLLSRFVAEGKKYATIAIGCTGGKHRSVFMAESLSQRLTFRGWPVVVIHRDLKPSDEKDKNGVGRRLMERRGA